MEWKEDSLQIFFSQMKNDQMAEKPRDPRHVYANPLMPEICPILALAISGSVLDLLMGKPSFSQEAINMRGSESILLE